MKTKLESQTIEVKLRYTTHKLSWKTHTIILEKTFLFQNHGQLKHIDAIPVLRGVMKNTVKMDVKTSTGHQRAKTVNKLHFSTSGRRLSTSSMKMKMCNLEFFLKILSFKASYLA